MADIDFSGGKATNMGDAKFNQDGINLRTAKILIYSATTSFTASTLTATTISLEGLQFIQPTTQPVPNSGLMWFSANTLYVYTGNTYSDLRKI